MKKEKKATESRLQTTGDWVKGVSFTLMISAFVACVTDLFFVTPGTLTVPVWGYFAVIGTGVALRFAGAAIPNMKFRWRSSKSNQAALHRIDDEV
jgi:membrane protein YqaA with SNARE-associated domain